MGFNSGFKGLNILFGNRESENVDVRLEAFLNARNSCAETKMLNFVLRKAGLILFYRSTRSGDK